MEGQEAEPRPGCGVGNAHPYGAGAHWGRAYPAMDSGSSMKTWARTETGCSSCSLILACGQVQAWAAGTGTTSSRRGSPFQVDINSTAPNLTLPQPHQAYVANSSSTSSSVVSMVIPEVLRMR